MVKKIRVHINHYLHFYSHSSTIHLFKKQVMNKIIETMNKDSTYNEAPAYKSVKL